MNTQNRLARITLNVEDPASLVAFYCGVLGMERFDQDGDITVGYGGQGAALVLRKSSHGPVYKHDVGHRYWKIAITLPNLDLAHEQLVTSGVAASDPAQFQDIAYMSHLSDTEGHVIELIQHTFAGKSRTSEGDTSLPMGGCAQIGLVTLRTSDIAAEKRYFLDEFGMTYLSRQEVPEGNFDLYFFAFTEETPPNADVNSIENREWLWQRPYTTLEFQHRKDGRTMKVTDDRHLGSATLTIEHGSGTHTEFG